MLPYRAELEQRVCVMVDDGSGLDDPPKCLFGVDLIHRHLLLVQEEISLPQAAIERLLVGENVLEADVLAGVDSRVWSTE